MKIAPLDSYFLFKMENKNLTGITGLATNDSISTSFIKFESDEEQTNIRFKTRKNKSLRFVFLGSLF